jgi:catechol 2,3-dioxygenase-like lactoylglutathione lyase family enzyme
VTRILKSAELVAFVAARDLARSGHFYGDLLGLRLIESSDFANVYEIGGTQLRVTRVETPVAAPYTVLGWRVPDIAATVATLAAAGVQCNRYDGLQQDQHGIWTAPGGSLIAWFSDPDGNTLSLQQSPDQADTGT